MEALLLMLNSLVVVILVFQGLRDDRRAPGTPAKGIFRSRDVGQAARPDNAPSGRADVAEGVGL